VEKGAESLQWRGRRDNAVILLLKLVLCNKRRVYRRRTPPLPHSAEVRPSFGTRTCLLKDKIFGHESRRGLKPGMIVLTRTSSNLHDGPAPSGRGSIIAWLPEPWGTKIQSWVPRDSETIMTVLARPSNNLSYPTRQVNQSWLQCCQPLPSNG
jgi:hypothetical protein